MNASAQAWYDRVPERLRNRPAFSFVVNKPDLPNVLLIGDSISISYTLAVRCAFKGTANVYRAPDNCRSTRQTREHLSAYLVGGPWDIVHFNFGIHDITRMDANGKAVGDLEGRRQVPLDEYETNLINIVDRLQATGAMLVWASTTAVQEGTPARDPKDVVQYNRTAERIMNERGITINDLYTVSAPRLTELQPPKNVHFTEYGAEILAGHVVGSIRTALAARSPA